MSNQTTSILMLITGIATGAALGILFAPKSGKDTRSDLMRKGEDLYDRLKDMVGQAQEKMADNMSKAKEKVQDMSSDAQRHTEHVRSATKA